MITELDKSIDKYQPDATHIPKQTWDTNKKAYFQNSWHLKYSWLHWDEKIKDILCIKCVNLKNDEINMQTKGEPEFRKCGFTNWKKALQKFNNHEVSDMHEYACKTVNPIPIDHIIDNSSIKKLKENRKC